MCRSLLALAALALGAVAAAAAVAEDLSRPPPNAGIVAPNAGIYTAAEMADFELTDTFLELVSQLEECEARRENLQGKAIGDDNVHPGWLMYFASCAAELRRGMHVIEQEVARRAGLNIDARLPDPGTGRENLVIRRGDCTDAWQVATTDVNGRVAALDKFDYSSHTVVVMPVGTFRLGLDRIKKTLTDECIPVDVDDDVFTTTSPSPEPVFGVSEHEEPDWVPVHPQPERAEVSSEISGESSPPADN
jgi:hypothetical protein